MLCHHWGTLEDREELLLKLFDMDEITNILMLSGDDHETDFYSIEGAPSAALATQKRT